MTQDEIKEEMRQDMLADAHEERANQKHQYNMRADYNYFADINAEAFSTFIDSALELKRLHKDSEQEFIWKDLEDLLWLMN